ncbi:MAG: NDP-sugar synthase [Myxococcales bacterium]|nr:MAG: NDP-sugar synthase [Myxococcales bacterium]
MTSALILAAGFGTRLRPLTLELPKPVVPVGDRPLLAHVSAACRRAGARQLVANVHHEHWKISSIIDALALNVDVVVEAQIRGTAGGVAGARARLGSGAVLVWNGDILTDAPAQELLATAAEHDAMVLAVAPRAGGEGTVGLDDAGHVVRLRGQVFGREARSADYMGVMALGPSVVAGLPEQGCLFADYALPHLAQSGRVLTVASLAPWSDLGDLPAYVAANWAWLAARGASSFVASGAELAPGVHVERSLIGAGAKVLGAGEVNGVIAWPGATLTAPLSRAVVLGSGLVVPWA